MRLPSSVVALFDYPVDDLVAVLPAAESPLWDKARFRQNAYDVHSQTRSIVFSWLDNSWRPGENLVVFDSDWGQAKLSAAVRACVARLLAHRPGKVAKLMLAELAPGTVIHEHTDQAPSLTLVHRCHVPIVTNEDIVFSIDRMHYYLAPGKAYEIDNTRRHAVENRSTQRRVHLICDIMPQNMFDGS
jgi:hypothetical protein